MTDALTIASVDYRPEPAGLPALSADTPVLIDPAQHFLPVPWELIEQAAELISSAPGLAPEFAEPKNCRFIAYQAARWRMDPIAVASKTYFMERKAKGNGPTGLILGYEAQLIMALINSDPELVEPLDFLYGYSDPTKKTAGFRFCKAVGFLRGIIRPRVVTSPTVSQIKVKNSPLWYSDPDQQLAYYTGRNWARRHRSGRLLGVYAREELNAFRDADDGVFKVRNLFEEEDVAAPTMGDESETVQPTEQDGKNFDRWEKKASGEGDSRDPRDDAKNSAGPPPPDGSDNTPPDLVEIRAWVETERKRIVALKTIEAVAQEGNLVLKDRRFRRLIAYSQADANAFDKSIKNRIAELES